MGWIGGWYYVQSETKNHNFFTKDFPTEQEARAFANEQWKLPYVMRVSIVKMAYYKKRRKAIDIAEARKEGYNGYAKYAD